MKVLHICQHYPPYAGGSAIRMESVLRPLARYTDIEVHVLAPMRNGEHAKTPRHEEMDGVIVHRALAYASIPTSTWSLCRKYDYDIIHAHTPRFAAMAWSVTRRTILLEFHSIWKLKGFKAWLTKTICHRSQRVFTLAESASDFISREYEIPREKIICLYNGVDHEQFDPSKHDGSVHRQRFEIGDAPLIGYAGTFFEWQGVLILIQSFAHVLRHQPNAKLVMLGNGPVFNKVIQLRRELGLEKNVLLPGQVPYSEIPSWMAAMDLCCILRPKMFITDTAVPLKVLECMAMNRCVVVTPVGGLTEVVEHNKTGWVTSGFEPESIGNEIARLIVDAPRREKLAAQAREYAVENFSWEKTAAMTKEAYDVIQHEG